MITLFTKISKYIFGDKYDYQQDRKNIDTDLLNAQIVINQLAKTVDNLPGSVPGTGDVVGPASSTDNAIVRFDGITGELIQDSAVTVADTNGNMAGVGTVNTHTIPSGTDTFALLTTTQTLTNKRINPRVVTLTDAATITPNIDTTDVGVLTSLSQNSTFANPTGTPVTGQGLILRVTSTTTRTLTFGSNYEASTTLILPTATTGSSVEDYIGFRYNSTSSKFVIVASTIGPVGDFSSNTSISVNNEIVLFSGVSGKLGKRATGNGVAIITNGALSSVAAPSGTIVGASDVQTLTDKIINPKLRLVTALDTSITPNSNTHDIINQDNAAALGTLTINADTGSPANGQRLLFRLTCTNVQTLAFNTQYQAISAMTLPSATTGGGTTDVIEFLWNTGNNKWQMILKTI